MEMWAQSRKARRAQALLLADEGQIGFDETNKQLTKQARTPLPIDPR